MSLAWWSQGWEFAPRYTFFKFRFFLVCNPSNIIINIFVMNVAKNCMYFSKFKKMYTFNFIPVNALKWLSIEKNRKIVFPDGESNPGLPHGYLPLYYGSYSSRSWFRLESDKNEAVTALGKIMRRFFLTICHFLQNSEFFSKWVILLKTLSTY